MARRAKDMAALEAKFAPKPKPSPAIAPPPPKRMPSPEVLALIDAKLGLPQAHPKPRRLSRQERAKVRQAVRDSAKRNGRSRRDLLEVERRNARQYRHGHSADILYPQDAGAGFVTADQLLRDLRRMH